MQGIFYDAIFLRIFSQAFFMTMFFIVSLYPLSSKLGLVDVPGGRKKHGQRVPLIGGIAIFFSFSLVLIYLLSMNTFNHDVFIYWLASFVLVILCLFDDIRPLSPRVRFAAQVLAISVVIFMGHTSIDSLGKMFGFGSFDLKQLAIPFTLFAVIGVINAVNMTDGLDGLAGSISLVESFILLFLAIMSNQASEVLILLVLIASLLGFLVFNFPNIVSKKYKVFLGDTGSMFVGFTLAWLCIRLSSKEAGYPPVLMLWVMALPIMDTIYLIFNRKARGVSPLKSDRRHLHHILQMYLSKQNVVIMMSVFSLLMGFIGVALFWAGVSELLLFLFYITLFGLYFYISHILRKKLTIKHKSLSLSSGL